MSTKFSIPPSSLDRAAFIERFGSVYEHSSWIAATLWDAGLSEQQDDIDAMAEMMADVLERADREAKLALICAHPDLAGRAAVRGELTMASTSEQANAGLDQCSVEEFSRFQELNVAYRDKFGFPFILAVKGKTRDEILEEFEARIMNDQKTEFETAVEQIHKIARFRLSEL